MEAKEKEWRGARGGEVVALPNHFGTVTIYRVKDTPTWRMPQKGRTLPSEAYAALY